MPKIGAERDEICLGSLYRGTSKCSVSVVKSKVSGGLCPGYLRPSTSSLFLLPKKPFCIPNTLSNAFPAPPHPE